MASPRPPPPHITIKPERSDPIDNTPAPINPPSDHPDDTCFVRNSSFLSRDIEAQKRRPADVPPRKSSIPATAPNPDLVPKEPINSPPTHVKSSPVQSPPIKSPPVISPLVKTFRASSGNGTPPAITASPPSRRATPPKNEVISPPIDTKPARSTARSDDNTNVPCALRESPVTKDEPCVEKLSLGANVIEKPESTETGAQAVTVNTEVDEGQAVKPEESNGVGDKIKKFEKAAEDANATLGRMSRPGSVRGRPRTERLGSDNSKEDLPPPATPFKDNVQFDLSANASTERPPTVLERQQSLTRNVIAAPTPLRWLRTDSISADGEKIRAEPQKIIKPEFKPMASPIDVTIRSPSLGAKIGDQFPSHGTAFRNVASPDTSRSREINKFNDDVNTQNNVKPCKLKNKEKYSVSKGSSYFTRGSEEIWLVKKKDIEEIEERVLDSFRRAGGNICMRSESMRPSSDSGQSVSFSHATMGRTKRPTYARSESLDPQWAGARAHTLKRQTSVACTCGHDKKPRAKSVETTPRLRSRSHGDDNNKGHVLDKYETLV